MKCILWFGMWLSVAGAEEPTLSLVFDKQPLVFTRSELLRSKDTVDVTVPEDEAYKGQRTYRAVPLVKLFSRLQLPDNAVIQSRSADGFVVVLAKDRLLNQTPQLSQAYLAIEPKEGAWPPLQPGKPSAGPFYLIWQNPALSKITRDEWPYQIRSFEVKGAFASLYPKVLPAGKPSESVRRGFDVFVKNCFTCHTLNLEGAAQVGPDLNSPMNPTEYFKPPALKRYIRNPQSMRHWPQSRMVAFPESAISDSELEDLIDYLKHMAKHRSR